MNKFVIITDSCSELTRELREELNIDYVSLRYTYDDKDVVADLDWSTLSPREFYDLMRNGKRVTTSQANVATYKEIFEKYLKEGYDILSLSVAAALSASVKSSFVARDELAPLYPDNKIICIDTRNACAGLGLMCIKAAKLRDEGKTIDEVAAWVEENRSRIHQLGTVDKLVYLKRAGRISAAKAFFGGLLNIKPIIISDVMGRNVAVESVKGRKVSFNRLIEMFLAEYEPSDLPIFISQADCMEDAEELRAMLIEALPDKSVPVHIVYVGATIGASVGPGMLGIYFWGNEVTCNAEEN